MWAVEHGSPVPNQHTMNGKIAEAIHCFKRTYVKELRSTPGVKNTKKSLNVVYT